jgi:hypothetical protein
MNPKVVQSILRQLKRKRGSTIDDFQGLVPPTAEFADAPPSDFFSDDLRQLIEWGLVEVYKGMKLVNLGEINSFYDRGLEFFLSPLAVKLESSLNISLTATPLFGEPYKSTYLPDLFMLMPFSRELKPVFEDHVKKVAANLGLSAGRADDFFSKGSIMQDVWSAIYYAKVIVADCTKRNPNVFYEIGIAHTLGKDTILISQALKDIPFDLRHLRTIIYEFTPRGMADLESSLESTLKSLL